MTDLIDLVQLQEIDDAIIRLFEFKLPNATIVRFASGLDDGTQNLYFPQAAPDSNNNNKYTAHEYYALPIAMTEIEYSATGPLPRPTLSMANIPVLSRTVLSNNDGMKDEVTLKDTLDAEGIYRNSDLIGTRVTVRTTLKKYTFTKQYEQAGVAELEPPIEFPTQTFIIDRVSGENELMVDFEMASPIDVEGVVVPGRVIVGKYCPWKYQGYKVYGEGGCDWPKNSRGRYYDVYDNVITKDISTITRYSPTSTYSAQAKVKTVELGWTRIWEAKRSVPANRPPSTNGSFWRRLDVCSKTITGCKIRFQGNSINDSLDTSNALPFGGFPGTKKFK